MIQNILGIVGWIGTALVFAAVAVRFVRPEWDQYAVYGAWAGLVMVLLYTAGQWRDILDYFRKRQARYGALATVSVLVALAIVIAVNYLSSRQNKRWDLTANQQNSLSEQTVKLLQGLTSPVKFTVFERQTDMDRFRTRLDEYRYQSGQVSTEYIDPDTRPVVAKEYEIAQYGTIVIDYQGRRERATSDSEQDITNALIKVISGQERTVYFVQGHGEKDPTRTERDGYSAVAGTLQRDNYKVEKLVLAQQKDVPENATVVVIAGPTSDFLPDELDALRRYVAKAGKVMVMIDPILDQGRALPNVQAFAREWGVELASNIVVDVSGASNDPSLAVAVDYSPHAITERLSTLTVYPLSRALQLAPAAPGQHVAQPVVQTTQASWAETDLSTLNSGTGVRREPEKGDTPGPVTLAAAATAPVEGTAPAPAPAPGETAPPKPESRVVIFGDSDFAANAYGGFGANLDLFANAVNWLAQQENLIAIRPKEATDRRVTMTARQQQGVLLISIFVVPALVFGTGIWTWWRRRA